MDIRRQLTCLLLLVGLRAGAAEPILIDMVHNNPGEAPFESRYNDPTVLKDLGYTGKVFELFESAQFGVDWAAIDPEVFPIGSPERTWVDAKAAMLTRFYDATKAAGLKVYCHTDMIVLPQRLIARRGLTHPGDISNPDTRTCVRELLEQIFTRFPQIDGLVVRIGETYLQGAPYHRGAINAKTDATATIIPLMNLLREEVCVRRGKQVFFRSWMSFDSDEKTYRAVSDGVEPHPGLLIVVKHCEGDFHRGNPFSKVLGMGRHRQLVEVQCQREYEGKGAYPNYIANGVIEGFEEHRGRPGSSLRSLWSSPLIAGVSTWSRGGGWKGPYLRNEWWCDLNVAVLARWVHEPQRTEADIFHDVCAARLGLAEPDASAFRTLCLDSAAAVLRGKRSTVPGDVSPWWSRDQFIGVPALPKDPTARQRVLAEKDAAVATWEAMVATAEGLHLADAGAKQHIVTSTRYGLYLYRIYRAAFHLVAVGPSDDRTLIDPLIHAYDQAWSDLRALNANHGECATLYEPNGFAQTGSAPGIGAFVDRLRHKD